MSVRASVAQKKGDRLFTLYESGLVGSTLREELLHWIVGTLAGMRDEDEAEKENADHFMLALRHFEGRMVERYGADGENRAFDFQALVMMVGDLAIANDEDG
jgi:hypothetical protein